MAEAPDKPGLGKRVLVVDDASLVRMYYRDALERAGYEVDEALNGLEALEKLHEGAADLLIVDVNMPQMDGFTFLKVLRAGSSLIRARLLRCCLQQRLEFRGLVVAQWRVDHGLLDQVHLRAHGHFFRELLILRKTVRAEQ